MAPLKFGSPAMRHPYHIRLCCFAALLAGFASAAPMLPVYPLPADALGVWQSTRPEPLGGAPVLNEAVERLDHTLRVLHITARPQEEDSALLAYLSRGRNFRVAHLSATHGESAHSHIGSERGRELSILRASESLAGRGYDGAEQYFLTLDDHGDTRDLASALEYWGESRAVHELTAFVRWWRPHVIIARHSPSKRDGDGFERAIGRLAYMAYERAAFRSFKTDGVAPWAVSAYYVQSKDGLPGKPNFNPDVGKHDPTYGKTYEQIAVLGRSQQRSQGMSSIQRASPRLQLTLVEHRLGRDVRFGEDPFAVIPDGSAALTDELLPKTNNLARKVRLNASAAASRLDQRNELVLHLLPGLAAAKAAVPVPNRRIDYDFRQTADAFTRALHIATGADFELRCDSHHAVPGEMVTFTAHVFAKTAPLIKPRVTLLYLHRSNGIVDPRRYELQPDEPLKDDAINRGQSMQFSIELRVPENADFTTPDPESRLWHLPFGNEHQALGQWPVAVATLDYMAGFNIGDFASTISGAEEAPIKVSTGPVHIWAERGEQKREALKIVPPVSLAPQPQMLAIRPGDQGQHEITVRVKARKNVSGELSLRGAPRTWRIDPPQAKLDLEAERSRIVTFRIDMIGGLQRQLNLTAAFRVGTRDYAVEETVLSHRHIEPTHIYRAAVTTIKPVDVILPDVRVGYVEGAGDDVAAALRALGANLSFLDSRTLASGNLAEFDTIITGYRAYEGRDDLVEAAPRLLEYVSEGGAVVVLQDGDKLPRLNVGPAAFVYASEHRVTDEQAKVSMLLPEHPILSRPNLINASDFKGWVSERGRYFMANKRDAMYKGLISCGDPGQEALDGGLVAASIGKGHWAYCAYSLHTQIEAGLPGAWRLLANLAALGHAGPGSDAVAVTPLELRVPKPPPRSNPPVALTLVTDPPTPSVAEIAKPVSPPEQVAQVVPPEPEVVTPPVPVEPSKDPSIVAEKPVKDKPPVRVEPPKSVLPPEAFQVPDAEPAPALTAVVEDKPPVRIEPPKPVLPPEAFQVPDAEPAPALTAVVEDKPPPRIEPPEPVLPPEAFQVPDAEPAPPVALSKPEVVVDRPPPAVPEVTPRSNPEPVPEVNPADTTAQVAQITRPVEVVDSAPPTPVLPPDPPPPAVVPARKVTPPAPLPPAVPDTEWPDPIDPPPPPTEITAENVEYDFQNHSAIFTNNVQVIDDLVRLRCDRLVVESGSEGDPERIAAIGNVIITSEDRQARGGKAVYDIPKGRIVLYDEPVLEYGSNEIVGAREIVYDRIRGSFKTKGRVTIRLRQADLGSN
jgi:lipopolysaccharide transport protein LptA